MTADGKSRKLTGVSRETTEEALKGLSIALKVLARRSHAMWDILLATEQELKQHAGNTLISTMLRLQTEYIDTRRIKITVHGVSVDICKDRMGAFYSKYGSVFYYKSGIATGDMLYVTLSRQDFGGILNVLMCREIRMLVVVAGVEGRRPYYWLCMVLGHIAKACLTKNPQPPPGPATMTTTSIARTTAVSSTEKAPTLIRGR